MAATPFTFAQASLRRDGIFNELDPACWKAKASYDWAQVTIAAGAPITMPNGGAISDADRADLLADYTILSNVYDLLHNRNPAQGGAALGVDVMAAVQARLVPGVNAE
jgi:hypothetical protein